MTETNEVAFKPRSFAPLQRNEVVWRGSGVKGACCLTDGSCQNLSQTDCEAQGGTYQGDGTDCSTNPCACDNGNDSCNPKYECCPGEDGCKCGQTSVGSCCCCPPNEASNYQVNGALSADGCPDCSCVFIQCVR